MDSITTTDTLATLIRKERKRQKVSQQQLAYVARVSRHFLINLEKGKTTSEIEKVFSVCQSLGIRLFAETPDKRSL